MIKYNTKQIKTAAIAIIIIIAIAGFIFFYNGSPTGQVTGKTTEDMQDIQKPAQNLVQQQIQQPVQVQNQNNADPRYSICDEKSAGTWGEEKTSYMENCMKYLYKLCFSDSECGTFKCLSNRCQ